MITMNRTILFYGLCITTRLGITISPLIIPAKHKNIVAIILGAVGATFLILWAGNFRLQAQEATGTITWWAPYRIIHAIAYLSASMFVYAEQFYNASGVLLTDTLLGTIIRYITIDAK